MFETYAVTVIATMLLGHLLIGEVGAVLYPLVLGGVSIIASVIGCLFVKAGKDSGIMPTLYRGLIIAALLAAVLFYPATVMLMGEVTEHSSLALWGAAIVGLVLTAAMVWLTEYYTGTDYGPVRRIAAACSTGHATQYYRGAGSVYEGYRLAGAGGVRWYLGRVRAGGPVRHRGGRRLPCCR